MSRLERTVVVVSDTSDLSRVQFLVEELDQLEQLVDRMGQKASSTKHSDQSLKRASSSEHVDQPPKRPRFSPMPPLNNIIQKELDAIKPGLQLFNVCRLIKTMPDPDWLHPRFFSLDRCKEAVENDDALAECISNCNKDDNWDPLFSESIHPLYWPI